MENLTDRIQDYIDGLLEGEDLAYFESQMQVDRELRDLVALQKEVYEIINKRVSRDEAGLRQCLDMAKDEIKKSKRSNTFFRSWMPIVAAACVLIFCTVFYLNQRSSLYDLPVMQSEIVRGQSENSAYEDAVKAFNVKSYAESREILMGLIEQDPSNIQYAYYAALTHYGEENWSQSIQQLKPIAEGESIYANEASYYLAAAYVKNNEEDKALALLKDIPQDGKLGEKAAKLLRSISR